MLQLVITFCDVRGLIQKPKNGLNKIEINRFMDLLLILQPLIPWWNIYTRLQTSRAEEGQVSGCSTTIRLMFQSCPFECLYISPLPGYPHQLAILVLQILINLREFPVCKLTLTRAVVENALLVRHLSLL